MLTISDDFTVLRVSAGEAMLFDLRLVDTQDNPLDLIGDGYRFVFAIFDDARTALSYHEGDIHTDDEGDFCRWVIDGLESDALYGTSNLLWQIVERNDNGREITAPMGNLGRLVIDMSAPRIDDLDSAPVARFITRITKRYDPTVSPVATFTKRVARYLPIASSQPSVVGADFSDPSNSGFLGVLV